MDRTTAKYFKSQYTKRKDYLLRRVSEIPASPVRYLVQQLPNDNMMQASITYDKTLGRFIRINTMKSTLEL